MAIFSDSIFQANMGTQFETPYESMYMAGGGWSTNAAYMSPSYMANFRPDYGGPEGFSPNNIPSFGTFGAIGAASALSSSPYYVNPLAYRNAAVDQLATAPADATMWGMQNIAAPLAAIAAGSAISGMRMPSFMPVTGAQRFAGGMAAAGAMAPRMGAAWWKTNISGTMSPDQFARYKSSAMNLGQRAAVRQSFGAFTGATLGRGAGALAGRLGGAAVGGAVGFGGRLLGMGTSVPGMAGSFAGTAGRGLAMAGGAVGAAAGSLLMPFMLASGAMDAANSMVFDPYIAARRGQQAITAGYADDFTGTSQFGLGMGRAEAAKMGGVLAQAGLEDRAFGIEGQINIFDMAKKAGMMSDVGNMDPQEIKKAVKNISRQVQAIMAVAGDPDVSRAIQRLAEMKKMGISGADANTTIQALGAAQAISGTSSLQIQNTVGTQASYLFNQAGISGQGSMQAASSAYAGFANAQKMGLINPAMMAMMGGAEGATQSFLTGQIGLGRSLYNQIGLANRFMFGGQQSGVLGNLSAFGAGVANNPLAAMGALKMNAGVMTGAQLQENPLAPTQGIFDLMDTLPGQMTRGRGGKYRWDAFSALALSQGLSEDQVRSQLELMRAYSDPDSVGRMRMATSAKARGDYAAFLERQGIDYPAGGIIGGAMRGFREVGLAGSRLKRGIVGGFASLNEAAGTLLDRATGSYYDYMTGGSSGAMSKEHALNRLRGGLSLTEQYDLVDPEQSSTNFGRFFDKLGDREAVLAKVERAMNSGALSEDRLNEIMGMSGYERASALSSAASLSEDEALMFARIRPNVTTTSEVGDTARSDPISKAVRQAFASRRSGRDRMRAGGAFARSLSTNDRHIMGSLAYSMVNDATSIKERLLSGGELTGSTKRARELLLKTLGVRPGASDDVALTALNSVLSDQNALDNMLGGFSEAFGKDQGFMDISAAISQLGYGKLDSAEGQNQIGTLSADRSRAIANLGIGGASTISTVDDLQKLSGMQQAAVEQQMQFERMADMGQLDFTGYMEATTANKMAVSTDKFSRAVDVFVRAVEADTGEQITGKLSGE